MKRVFLNQLFADEMIISGQDAHHIINVLRYKIGDNLIVVDIEQNILETKIVEIGADFVKIKYMNKIDANTESPIEVVLAQCLPKADKMDFIVQKAVELGVNTIYPVISENCVVKYDASKKEAKQKKWQKIASEAAKQCGRTMIPDVESIITLKELLQSLDKDTEAFFCYEQEKEGCFKELLQQSKAKRFFILIGPEGGFSPAEAHLCKQYKMKSVTLGPRILRAETAAVAAVSIVMYQNGDLGGRS